MKSRTLLSLVGILSGLFAGASARAQTPLGGDLVIAAFPPNVYAEYSPQPVCDDAGVCGLFWEASHIFPDNRSDIIGVAISQRGRLLTESKVLATVGFGSGPIAVGLERGFAVFWNGLFSDTGDYAIPLLQYFDESLAPKGPPIILPFRQRGGINDPNAFYAFITAVRTPSGFALYGEAFDTPSIEPDIFIYFIDGNGKPTHGRQRLNEDISDQSLIGANSLAVLSNGDLVAVYWRFHQTGNVYMRRLTPDGALLGPETRVNTKSPAFQAQPAVAAAPDGSFMVTWQSSRLTGDPTNIMARPFSATGTPIGKPFQVNDVPNSLQQQAAITADSQGNYFIAWQCIIGFNGFDIKGRLFRHDGTPVAGEISLNQVQDADQDSPQVVFTRSGTVIVGWKSSNTGQAGAQSEVPVVRVFATPREP